MENRSKLDKLRVSYSLLSMWERGQIDRAIATYFHAPMKATEPMKQGRTLHNEIEKHINKNKKLPDWLPKLQLYNPKPEEKLIVEYSDEFDISVVIDCLDEPNMFEWKTGVTDSLTCANTKQIPFYFLACELAGVPVKKAYLVHYNQHEKTKDWTIIWNNKTARENARNYIDSIAPEIQSYFLEAGFLR